MSAFHPAPISRSATVRVFPLFVALLLAPIFASLSSAASAGSAPAAHDRGTAEAAAPVGWWRDATFYEIFVRSFADASSGPLADDGIGDLQGLIDRLDYLNDGRGTQGDSLGVNALWLMPIHPSPSYHGYDVSDYFAVNPQYGDIALMKRFVHEAHRRGIRVIIDLVLNHASSEHPLFRAALAGDAEQPAGARAQFRFAPIPQDIYGPWGQRAWHPTGKDFYYGVFSSDMPDWNFRDPAVTEHHRRAAEFWLRDVGVDGFRLDAVRYFFEDGDALQDTEETRRWLREFTAYCHEIEPAAFVIGENTADLQEVARCIRGGSFDSGFEFDLAKATLEAVRLRAPGMITRTLNRLHGLYGNSYPWGTHLTNHDQERVRTQLGDDTQLVRLATKVFFTLPGVPFLYYGEELGLRGAKPDPELRTPMPWTAEPPNAGFTLTSVQPWKPVTPDFSRWNVAVAQADPESLLALYRHLIELNANSPALRHGDALKLTCDDLHTYAVARETEHEVVVVLGNFAQTPRPGPALSLNQSRIRRDWTMQEIMQRTEPASPAVDGKGGFSNWRPFETLPPESVFVIRWAKP